MTNEEISEIEVKYSIKYLGNLSNNGTYYLISLNGENLQKDSEELKKYFGVRRISKFPETKNEETQLIVHRCYDYDMDCFSGYFFTSNHIAVMLEKTKNDLKEFEDNFNQFRTV